MHPSLPGQGPILAYFGGYDPADRRTFELALLVEGAARRTDACLVSLHTGTLPGLRPHEAALLQAQGRSIHADDLRDRPHLEVEELGTGPVQGLLDLLLACAWEATERGIPLRQRGQIVAMPRRFCYTLPEVFGVFPARELPERLLLGQPVDHPQLWTPGIAVDQLPRRHRRRAAREDHPLWSA